MYCKRTIAEADYIIYIQMHILDVQHVIKEQELFFLKNENELFTNARRFLYRIVMVFSIIK
jgi:hypothetical protein